MESYALKELTLRLFQSIFAEPEFAAAPACGLALQIVLTLLNLFGRRGKVVLLLLLLAACAGAYVAKEQVIGPDLASEAVGGRTAD